MPQLIESESIEYEVLEDKVTQGSWRVEAIDYGSEGEIYIAIFSGPKSKQRAEEYYLWKSRQANK